MRLSPLLAAVGGVLIATPESRAERDRGQDDFFGAVVQRLADLGALKPELARNRALDIVSAIDSVETFTELVVRRGWTADEWRTWLSDVLRPQLVAADAEGARSE